MRAYYTAATLARLGDEMVATALTLFLLMRTANPVLTGVTLAAYSLPSVFSGPLLGSWLDGTRHRRAVLAANQVALAASMLGLLAAPSWAAPGFAVIAGLALPMTSAGFSAMVPRLAGPERLTRANSLDSLSFSAASMSGPAVAGGLAVVAPSAPVLGVACAAVGSLVALAFVAPVPPSPHGRQPVLTGLRHILRTPQLRAVTLTTTLSWGASGLLLVALALRTKELGVGEHSSGFVLTVFEIGCVVTNLALIRLQNRWQTVLVTIGIYGLVLGSWSLAGTFAVLLVLALVAGFVIGPEFPALLAARQRYSPPELLGQVGAYSLGAAAVGWVLPVLGAQGVLALVGGLQVLSALAGWLVSRRTSAPEPDAAATAGPRRAA